MLRHGHDSLSPELSLPQFDGSDPDPEPLKETASRIESAYARFQRSVTLNSTSAPLGSKTEENLDTQRKSCGGRSHERVSTPESGFAVSPSRRSTSSLVEAPGHEPGVGTTPFGEEKLRPHSKSIAVRDPSLREPLSEADKTFEGLAATPPSLLIRFNTAGSCRIIGIDRQGSHSSFDKESGLVEVEDHRALGRLDRAVPTPSTPTEKRRGRPPGSKNKSPSTLPGLQSRSISPSNPRERNVDPAMRDRDTLRKQRISEAMKASWAKRQSNGTSDHRGGAFRDKIQKKYPRAAEHRGQNGTVTQTIQDPTDRPLFKGQHAIRSASGPRLPNLTAQRGPSSRGGWDTHGIHPSTKNATRKASPKIEAASLSKVVAFCDRDPALVQIFESLLCPALVAAKNRHRGTFPERILVLLCKHAAEEIMSEKFRRYLRDNGCNLSNHSRKLISKHVRKVYAKHVKIARSQAQEINGPTLKHRYLQNARPNTAPLHKVPRNNSKTPQAALRKSTSNSRVLDAQEVLGRSDLNDSAQSLSQEEKQDRTQDNGQLLSQGVVLKTSSTFTGADNDDKGLEGTSLETVGSQGPVASRATRCDFCRYQHGNEYPVKRSTEHRQKDPSKMKARTAFDPELELACANAALCEPGRGTRPYKSARHGHCDFIREECLALLQACNQLDHSNSSSDEGDILELRQHLRTALGDASDDRITAIIRTAVGVPGTSLINRKRKSIRAFLVDLKEGSIPAEALPSMAIPQVQVSAGQLNVLLQTREQGLGPASAFRRGSARSRACNSSIQQSLFAHVEKDLRPWRSWVGASGDVVSVAWHPDSLSYATAAVAQSDDNDLQYNRPYNLLRGDLVSNTLKELPDHRIARPRPETIASGPNSTLAVYQACDPMVYKTVTSVHFSPQGHTLYTSSHDETVKIWDVGSTGIKGCSATLGHGAEVTSLEVSAYYPGVFATASKKIDNAVRLYRTDQHDDEILYHYSPFSSPRAQQNQDKDIFPECLRWGLAPSTRHLLLGGFQQWADYDDFSVARQGEICLWDVNREEALRVRPHTTSILAVAWHHQEGTFITGGAPGHGPLTYPKRTQSVVRSYDIRSLRGYTVEFECPALDMQDVTFHPQNSNYVTAACSDGSTYVWDYRKPDDVLLRLEHGEPLQEMPPNEENLPDLRHRENVDAGVMLSIWGSSDKDPIFYTGSSDGVIKAWDIRRSSDDAWIRDVASLSAGIQSGAMSPDGTHMLVGDAVGGVHVLSAAPFGQGEEQYSGSRYVTDPITFQPAKGPNPDDQSDNPGTEGIQAAKELLESGRLEVHDIFGAGKGPNYDGPFDQSKRWYNPRTGYNELEPDHDAEQAFSAVGKEQYQSQRIRAAVSARCEWIMAAKRDSSPLTISLGPPSPFVANRKPRTIKKRPSVSEPAGRVFAIPSKHRNTSSQSTRKPAAPLKSEVADDAFRQSSEINSPSSPSGYPRPVTYIDLTKKRKHSGDKTTTTPKRVIVASKDSKAAARPLAKKQVDFVDLTGDDDEGENGSGTLAVRVSGKVLTKKEEVDASPFASSLEGFGAAGKNKVKKEEDPMDGSQTVEGNLLSWEEWVEDDYW
ncbi:MAG: hypothetical protein Q9183_000769 [Haloplaca sp. 2 TL-2023]